MVSVCRMPPDTGKWRDKRDAGNTHKSPHAEEMLGFLRRRLQVRLTSLFFGTRLLLSSSRPFRMLPSRIGTGTGTEVGVGTWPRMPKEREDELEGRKDSKMQKGKEETREGKEEGRRERGDYYGLKVSK